MDTSELFYKVTSFISSMHDLEIRIGAKIQDRELSPSQHTILQVLGLNGSKSLGSISSCVGMNLPNTSREVKKLQELGLVTKNKSSKDKRITEIDLSDKGKEWVTRSFKRLEEDFFSQNASQWDDAALEECAKAIHILEKNLFNWKA